MKATQMLHNLGQSIWLDELLESGTLEHYITDLSVTASDVLYIGALAAPNTVNTMPEETLLAFGEHAFVEGSRCCCRCHDSCTWGHQRRPQQAVLDGSTPTGAPGIRSTPDGSAASEVVRKLIIDSLRLWVHAMHVDGFRFDPASIFSRNNDGSINLDDPPLITEITGSAEYGDVRLIAEAWDPVSYELGRSFPGQS
jgi:hypothetical protein